MTPMDSSSTVYLGVQQPCSFVSSKFDTAEFLLKSTKFLHGALILPLPSPPVPRQGGVSLGVWNALTSAGGSVDTLTQDHTPSISFL